MSKIIRKKDLDLVIESTLKEVGLFMEDESCGTSYMEEEPKPDFLDLDDDGDTEEPMKDAYKKVDHEDRDEFDGRESKVIGVDSDIKDQRLGEDSEGEETYNYSEDEGKDAERLKKGHMSKSHMDALADDMSYDENHEDRDEPHTHFESTEDVVKKSVDSLSKAVVNTTNNNLIKEEINNFNKLINYRK